MDRTLKMRAFAGKAKEDGAQDNLTKEQKLALELAAKNTQLEEEKSKSLEQAKTIEHLRGALIDEQSRRTELTKNAALLEARVKELSDALDSIAKIATQRKAP